MLALMLLTVPLISWEQLPNCLVQHWVLGPLILSNGGNPRGQTRPTPTASMADMPMTNMHYST